MNSFDVIVIGGGHAGIEAAWAAAGLGARTALITFDRRAIGRMSCNPAIGGIGKGQMVREIDALGGAMARITDAAGIQFRTLNLRKGPAVQAPRAQCDRTLYEQAAQALLTERGNLTILEGSVERLVTEAGAPDAARMSGVALADGRVLACRAVVVTTGTFLRGLMHCGEQRSAGGRVGEAAAVTLSDELRRLGLELGRLKTGTPPRLARDSIDFDSLEQQPGEDPPRPFSFLTDRIRNPQIACWITYTNPDVHELIRANLHRAPMYSGRIQSRGPRYCPSIEDKVVRFAERERHQIFLEPEGYDSDRIYCNGISTSLPAEVQAQLVRRIAGLEQARIVQPGYAVEYDFVPPQQIRATLECKQVGGLYFAGQINGTSGYEEAAGQGLMAGLNAALSLAGRPPAVLSREAAYIGVMIDDLVTRGTREPYRMFTSRAEHRLSLRSDNADARLTPLGREWGLVDERRWRLYESRRGVAQRLAVFMRDRRRDGRPLAEWIRRPDVDWRAELRSAGWDACVRSTQPAPADDPMSDRTIADAVETCIWDLRYEGYVRRQAGEIERHAALDQRALPTGFDFTAIAGLRAEAREKLSAVQPLSVGQARRIPGITPSDVTLLLIHLSRRGGR